MTDIKLGQYVHGNSFIHLLDPRTKIISCIFVIISVLISYNMYYLLFFMILMAVAIITSKLEFKYILSTLYKMRYLLLFTFVFQAFLTTGVPIFMIGKLSITREGLILGAINISRLVILYLGSMILLMTTSPIKLSAGIESLLIPLSRLKIPVHNFTTIISISFRFIPTLFEEATVIKNAQKSRGAQFDSPKIMVRLKSYVAILIPLFEASLVRAVDLGEAMDSRCYSAHPNKVRLNRLKITRQDITTLFFMSMVLLVGIILTIYPIANCH